MSSFKSLHSFTVTLDKEVSETTTREENGQTITVTSKVTKPLAYTILLKEPSRSEKNELALFKDVTYGYAIDKGLVTKLKMQQKLGKSDPTNPLSEDEDKNLSALSVRLQELEADYLRLNSSTTPETMETKERKEKILLEYLVLRKKIEDMNTSYQSVYAHTAENYTQTKMLTWLTLFLTYVKDPTNLSDSVPRPMFLGNDYDSKEEKLGELEDAEDPLYLKALEKLPTYWMLYLFGRANKPDDFKEIEESWEKEKKLREEMEARAKVEAEKAAVVAEPVAAPAPVAPPEPPAAPALV
jgi:hypothetical protein